MKNFNNIEDIENNWIIEFRNGDKYIKKDNYFVRFKGRIELNYFNNLKHKTLRSFDIVKIWKNSNEKFNLNNELDKKDLVYVAKTSRYPVEMNIGNNYDSAWYIVLDRSNNKLEFSQIPVKYTSTEWFEIVSMSELPFTSFKKPLFLV